MPPNISFRPNPRISYRNLSSSATGFNPIFRTQPYQNQDYARLDSTRLPPNYGFEDLAGYEEERRRKLGEQFRGQIGQLKSNIESRYNKDLQDYKNLTAQRRAALSSSLGESAQRTFQQSNPYILEDLQSRGLFTSPSAVAQAQSERLKEIELANQQRLLNFDETARNYEDALARERLGAFSSLESAGTSADIQAQQDALDAALDLRRSQLEAKLGEAASSREEKLAQDLAKRERRSSLYNALIGAGGSLGSAYLTSKLLGGAEATGLATALPLAGLTAGGVLGYKALPDKAKAVVAPLVNPLRTAKTIGKSIKKFCFDSTTPIIMLDGDQKIISDIKIGDKTKGGIVESIRISKTDDGTLYNYKGIEVTGSHAVKENGRWIRVENSSISVPIKGERIVWSLVTDKHRIYVNDIELADEHETNNYEELTIDESLQELNKQENKEYSYAI